MVASNGLKMPPVFIDAGLKVNIEVYIGILRDRVLPWIKENCFENQYVVLQQDGTPCHTLTRTLTWLTENMNFRHQDLRP